MGTVSLHVVSPSHRSLIREVLVSLSFSRHSGDTVAPNHLDCEAHKNPDTELHRVWAPRGFSLLVTNRELSSRLHFTESSLHFTKHTKCTITKPTKTLRLPQVISDFQMVSCLVYYSLVYHSCCCFYIFLVFSAHVHCLKDLIARHEVHKVMSVR